MRPRPRALAAGMALVAALSPAGPAAASTPPDAVPAPDPRPARAGEVFPVVRAQGRWMIWRDTFGAPRMRLEDDGVWRQVGVHQGIDIYAEKGAQVVSLGPGVVEQVGWTFYSGRRVGVRGDDGKYYFYAHLSSISPGVAKGARVAAGSGLGEVGSSGYGPEGTADEFPPHLHFGVQSARWENPARLLRSLYAESVSATEQARRRLKGLRRQRRLLRARSVLPGAPEPARVAAGLAAVNRAIAEAASRAALRADAL